VVFNKFDTGRSVVLSGVRCKVCGRPAKPSSIGVRKHQSCDGNHSLPARDPHAERMRIPRDPQAWHTVPLKALLCSCFYLDSLGNR